MDMDPIDPVFLRRMNLSDGSPVLGEHERKTLLVRYLAGNPQGATTEELAAFINWASHVRVLQTVLDSVAAGKMHIRMRGFSGDREQDFAVKLPDGEWPPFEEDTFTGT